ncbi:MAG TPA: hypothetical protein VFJ79_05255, partial [Acidimicrobiales bacterium]|nr:hypothetical protein [Acidimicrobiales bacterium]
FVAVPIPRDTVAAPVTLTYSPPGIRPGLALAALGAAMATALTAIDAQQRRRRRAARAPDTTVSEPH